MKWFVFLISMLHALITVAQTGQKLNPVVWKIQKANEAASYIWATGPVCNGEAILPWVLKKILDSVTTVAIEYEMYNAEDSKKLARLSISENDSVRTSSILSAADYGKLIALFKSKGLPDAALQRFGGFRISMMYYLILTLSGPCGTLQQPESYESSLRAYAGKNKKQYSVLQTTDDFVKEFLGIPASHWKQAVTWLLQQHPDFTEQLQQSETTFYKAGNLEGLRQLYKNKLYQFRQDGNTQFRHINDLTASISKLTEKGSNLVAMDLGTILFEDSRLLHVLKEKGYSITRLTQ